MAFLYYRGDYCCTACLVRPYGGKYGTLLACFIDLCDIHRGNQTKVHCGKTILRYCARITPYLIIDANLM